MDENEDDDAEFFEDIDEIMVDEEYKQSEIDRLR